MEVKLISSYNSEVIAHIAASKCVAKEPSEKGFLHAIKSGHFAVLDHLPLTFEINGVSRSLLAQLTRHRLAAYCVESQRYRQVETHDQSWNIVPHTIESDPTRIAVYRHVMSQISDAYNMLIDLGVPKEDARYVLPEGCVTNLVMTMDASEFVHVCTLRLCNRAQWEIREMIRLCREAIKYVYPNVYKLAVPNCKKHGCLEERPCGKPWKESE